VVSIVLTRRRRFMWAAWWTAPPTAEPFRKPDASHGGASTREEAHAAAELSAGRTLTVVDGRWALAWSRILRGQAPWLRGAPTHVGPAVSAAHRPVAKGSKAWARALLGVDADASAEAIKKAFRALALRTHPDQGGETSAFLDAKRARDVLLKAILSRSRSG
jgi:hypothetical protein